MKQVLRRASLCMVSFLFLAGVAGLSCGGGGDLVDCVVNEDCPEGQYCNAFGECQGVQSCDSNADCNNGEVCEDGFCSVPD